MQPAARASTSKDGVGLLLSAGGRGPNGRAWVLAALIVAEIAGLVLAYQVLADFECQATGSEATCRLVRGLLARGVVAGGALGLFAWLRRSPAAGRAGGTLMEAPAQRRADDSLRPGAGPSHGWMALHLLGVALMLYPLALLPGSEPSLFFERALLPWSAGALCGMAGAALWLAPLLAWRRWLAREGPAALLVAGVASLVPDLTSLVLPLWDWQPLTSVTFSAVLGLLSLAGAETYVEPETYVIGLDDFYVLVGPPCSGVEGFALIGSFVALYAVLFRRDLRLLRFWLLVLPLGLAASWALNVVRISALVLLGARVSPELAVDGFHSYAGWMFFTLLALALVWLVHVTPGLHAEPGRPAGPPLREDWLAARILPLTVLFVSGTIGSALTIDAELAAPYRAVALAAALWFFWTHRARLRPSPDPVALGAGLAVGALWVVVEPAPANGDLLREALSGFGPVALAAWIALRVLGSTLLVPLAEELFFRGYLLARLDLGGRAGTAIAVAVSSALFAALHSRWLEAGLAGVVFALVMLRRNRLGDAVVAHIAANGLIALAAAVRGDWAAI